MTRRTNIALLLLCLGALSGCPTPEPNADVTVTVGSDGGEVENDSALVTIPAGALSADVEVTVGAPGGEVAALPDGVAASGPAVALTPHGTAFASPVTVELTHDGTADTVLRLDDESDTTWEPVADLTIGATSVTFSTSTFSIYLATSRCTAYCNQVSTECSSNFGDCRSACSGVTTVGPLSTSCAAAQATLLTCYEGTAASGFDCVTSLPVAGTCATERADSATACGAPTTTGTCPCFTMADMAAAWTGASSAGGEPANGSTDWGTCTYTGASWADPTSANSIWIEARAIGGGSSLYQGIYSVGQDPNPPGDEVCMVWKEGSAAAGPPLNGPTVIGAADMAACRALLDAYVTQQWGPPATFCVDQN